MSDVTFGDTYFDARMKYTDQLGKSIDRIQSCVGEGDLVGLYMALMSYDAMTSPFQKSSKNKPFDSDVVLKSLEGHYNVWKRDRSDVNTMVFFKRLMFFYKNLMFVTQHLLMPVAEFKEMPQTAEEMEEWGERMMREMGL